MKSVAVVFTLLALLAAGATYGPLNAGAKVVICHVPPGNPEQAKTLSIGARAAAKHLAVRVEDSLGGCSQISGCAGIALAACESAVEGCDIPGGRGGVCRRTSCMGTLAFSPRSFRTCYLLVLL